MAADELGDGRRALRGDAFTSVGKAARDLGLGERTVRHAIATGALPTYVFGRRARLKVADVRAWVEANRRRP
jgi:excisionase family DNA binding protein